MILGILLSSSIILCILSYLAFLADITPCLGSFLPWVDFLAVCLVRAILWFGSSGLSETLFWVRFLVGLIVYFLNFQVNSSGECGLEPSNYFNHSPGSVFARGKLVAHVSSFFILSLASQ